MGPSFWSDPSESRDPRLRWLCLPGMAILASGAVLVEVHHVVAVHPWVFFASILGVFALTSFVALWNEDGLCYFLASMILLVNLALWIDLHLMIWNIHPAFAACAGCSLVFLAWAVLMRRRRKSFRLGRSSAILPIAAVFVGHAPSVFAMISILWKIPQGEIPGVDEISFNPARWALCTIMAMVCCELVLKDSQLLRVLSLVALAPLGLGTLMSLAVSTGWFCVFLIGIITYDQARNRVVGPLQSTQCHWLLMDGRYLALGGLVLLCQATVTVGVLVPASQVLTALFILAAILAVLAHIEGFTGVTMATVAMSQVGILLYASSPTFPLEAPQGTVERWGDEFLSGRWGRAAILMSACMVSFSLLLYVLSRWRQGTRQSPPHRVLSASVACAPLVAAQFITLSVGDGAQLMRGDFLFLVHLLWTAILIAIAALEQLHVVPLIASVLGYLFYSTWFRYSFFTWDWPRALVWVGAENLVFLAYVLLHRRRIRAFLSPFLAFILSGIPLYRIGKDAFVNAGLGHMVVSLPLLEAGLAVLLILALRPNDFTQRKERLRVLFLAGAALIYLALAVAAI